MNVCRKNTRKEKMRFIGKQTMAWRHGWRSMYYAVRAGLSCVLICRKALFPPYISSSPEWQSVVCTVLHSCLEDHGLSQGTATYSSGALCKLLHFSVLGFQLYKEDNKVCLEFMWRLSWGMSETCLRQCLAHEMCSSVQTFIFLPGLAKSWSVILGHILWGHNILIFHIRI